jgi:hypothetical protein
MENLKKFRLFAVQLKDFEKIPPEVPSKRLSSSGSFSTLPFLPQISIFFQNPPNVSGICEVSSENLLEFEQKLRERPRNFLCSTFLYKSFAQRNSN